MQKLVSRNPVLRFKEGLKIIKALRGTYIPVIIGSSTFLYNPYNGTYKGTSKENILYRDIVNAFNSQYESLGTGNDALYRKKGSRLTWINSRGRYVDRTPKSNLKVVLTRTIAVQPGSGSTKQGQKAEYIRNHYVTNSSPSSSKVVGKSFKSTFDLARNSGLQEFTWNGKKYNTMRAGETRDLWLNSLNPQITTPLIQSVNVPQSTSISSLPPVPTLLPQIQITPIRNANLNRSLIRGLISLSGFNPYNYTGELRKALRLYLNGQSNDTSLLDGTDLARFTLPYRKNGGTLSSGNPIERFKHNIHNNIINK